jgi:16S rRNA (uracil1498-N3)-methyltransferase
MSRHAVDEVRAGSLTLSGETAHHLRRVLRVRVGARLVLFDARGREAEAEVVALAKDAVEVRVGEPRVVGRESPLALTLAFALSKGDKPEWIAQKAVELGVQRLVLFAAARSVARWAPEETAHKTARLAAVIRGAAAQCGRNALPPFAFAPSLAEAVARLADHPRRIALHPEAATPLAALLREGEGPVALLCGPEGGLAPDEITLLREAGWRLAALGPRILRAETATLAALAVAQSAVGDLGQGY